MKKVEVQVFGKPDLEFDHRVVMEMIKQGKKLEAHKYIKDTCDCSLWEARKAFLWVQQKMGGNKYQHSLLGEFEESVVKVKFSTEIKGDKVVISLESVEKYPEKGTDQIRPCQCGSGLDWAECNTNSPFCG